jgi:hypothetical protein
LDTDFDFLAFIDEYIRLAHFAQFHVADEAGVERIRFEFWLIRPAAEGDHDDGHRQNDDEEVFYIFHISFWLLVILGGVKIKT